MESTPFLHTQTHHYSFADLHRLLHQQDVRRRPHLTMPLRDLTLRRITTNRNSFRFNQATESFSIAEPLPYTSINRPSMADETKRKDVSQGEADAKALSEKDKASEKSTPAIPPPEKPLPGDCCGSGCGRCVWDVYYEELEEYNKLQKADPKIS